MICCPARGGPRRPYLLLVAVEDAVAWGFLVGGFFVEVPGAGRFRCSAAAGAFLDVDEDLEADGDRFAAGAGFLDVAAFLARLGAAAPAARVWS